MNYTIEKLEERDFCPAYESVLELRIPYSEVYKNRDLPLDEVIEDIALEILHTKDWHFDINDRGGSEYIGYMNMRGIPSDPTTLAVHVSTRCRVAKNPKHEEMKRCRYCGTASPISDVGPGDNSCVHCRRTGL
jgi:hypothetical protein